MSDLAYLQDVRPSPVPGPSYMAYAYALRETLRRTPYNSAAEYHRVFGDGRSDRRLGAACVYQTIEAAELAVSLGMPQPHFVYDDRHVAAVFHDGGSIVILDPYLLHLEPIVLPATEVRSGASEVSVDAAPKRQDPSGQVMPSRVTARYTRKGGDDYVIRLHYSRYSPTSGRYFLSRHFSLRSQNRASRESFGGDMQALLTHPEQTSMSVRAVDVGPGQTIEAILPLSGFAERKFGHQDIWLRTNQGAVVAADNAEAERWWRELEEILAIDRLSVVEHLLGGADIYRSIADPDRTVAPYQLKDE